MKYLNYIFRSKYFWISFSLIIFILSFSDPLDYSDAIWNQFDNPPRLIGTLIAGFLFSAIIPTIIYFKEREGDIDEQ